MKTLIQKGRIHGLKKWRKTRHQIENTIHKAAEEVKPEMLTPDEIKAKALKILHFHKEITKARAQEITPRIIVQNTIKRKESFFKKVGQLQKNLKPLQS